MRAAMGSAHCSNSTGKSSSRTSRNTHCIRLILPIRARRGRVAIAKARIDLARGRGPRPDLRLAWPVILLRGLPATAGSLRRSQVDSPAGSARDERKPAVVKSKTYSDLQALRETGATGLEPATSGRDRPVMALPGWAVIGGDYSESRSFRPGSCGDWRVPAGASGVLPRDLRGMERCLECQRWGGARNAVVVMRGFGTVI